MNKWVLGARPRTLPAAITPVLIGTVLTGSDWNPLRALLALFVSVALQIAVNYSNDYSDGIRGTDDNRVGPIRLVGSKLATASQVRNAALIVFLLASIAGFILAYLTSWFVLLIGVAALAAAWGYTGGKRPYGYKGFGEISVFIFFGFIATVGTSYVQTEIITSQALFASVPMGALSCALLAMNNIRDRAQDLQVGKKTLAVRLGERNSRTFFVTLILIAYLFAAIAAKLPSALTLLALPLALPLCRDVLNGAAGRDLIPLLGKTGKLQLLFALTFAIALAL